MKSSVWRFFTTKHDSESVAPAPWAKLTKQRRDCRPEQHPRKLNPFSTSSMAFCLSQLYSRSPLGVDRSNSQTIHHVVIALTSCFRRSWFFFFFFSLSLFPQHSISSETRFFLFIFLNASALMIKRREMSQRWTREKKEKENSWILFTRATDYEIGKCQLGVELSISS